jgi:hypothetical protein
MEPMLGNTALEFITPLSYSKGWFLKSCLQYFSQNCKIVSVAGVSEILVPPYQTTHPRISILHSHCCENVKFYMIIASVWWFLLLLHGFTFIGESTLNQHAVWEIMPIHVYVSSPQPHFTF